MNKLIRAGIVAFLLSSSAAFAFERIEDKDSFMSVVADRDLKRFGIRLKVTDDGGIQGRAFGQAVTGSWEWTEDGYFCRDLFYGESELGSNCQTVEVRGDTLRFTSDRGSGQSANLTLD